MLNTCPNELDDVQSFQTEWIKKINIPFTGYYLIEGILANVDDEIIYISKQYLHYVSGITFTKMDFEGNIVK